MNINVDDYKARFAEPPQDETAPKEADTRAGRALALALDIRKFEIELYWKRATYFWAFIAAAFAGYALTYKAATEPSPWLSFIFSALGVVFSFAWYLVNRGSKFWQNNWERHVDLLEDMTLGPLYKVVAVNTERNPLTASKQFSVTKINQMLSLFVTLVWVVLFAKSVGPISLDREFDAYKFAATVLTVVALAAIWTCGRSTIGDEKSKLKSKLILRTFDIET